MGAGSSHFTADESETLSSFVNTTPWSYDSDKWLNLFRYKFSLLECNNQQLTTLFTDYCNKLYTNNELSHNLSTLGSIIYGRIKKSWYFNNTDIELTTSAVVSIYIFIYGLINR